MLKKRNTAGYSLIEILVGIAIMGSSLMAVAGVYPFASAHIHAMGNRIFVIQQAQAKMETIKSMSYKTLMEDYVVENAKMQQQPLEDTGSNKFEGYKFTASFQAKKKNLIHIIVEIEWDEENAYGKYTKEKKYILDGYKSQIEM